MKRLIGQPILTAAEMRAAEDTAIANGATVESLMARAGAEVAEAVRRPRFGRRGAVPLRPRQQRRRRLCRGTHSDGIGPSRPCRRASRTRVGSRESGARAMGRPGRDDRGRETSPGARRRPVRHGAQTPARSRSGQTPDPADDRRPPVDRGRSAERCRNRRRRVSFRNPGLRSHACAWRRQTRACPLSGRRTGSRRSRPRHRHHDAKR